MTESGSPARLARRLRLLNIIAVVLIGLFDGVASAGVVVGFLLVIPIMASASADDPREIGLILLLAITSFLLATYLGNRTMTIDPRVPNRVIVVGALAASAYVALLMQRRRLQGQQLSESAAKTFEINRLLMSLIAHDLRAPLATALHTLDYLQVSRAHPEDSQMVSEARGRLRRSLRVVDAFVSVAGPDVTTGGTIPTRRPQYITGIQLATILQEEMRVLEVEAATRGKVLELDVSGLGTGGYLLDVLVLRQGLTILVDNAIRYAVPGPIQVRATMTETEVSVVVEDNGPGLGAGRKSTSGMGMGLELCGSLLRRADGKLDVLRDGPDGTAFLLQLPLRREGTWAPPRLRPFRPG